MSKGKQNKNQNQVINNINHLNLEIDYDKLADAIIHAEKRATQKERIDNTQEEKISVKKFFSAILKIITNKTDTGGVMLQGTFALILNVFFNLLAFVCVIIAILFFVAVVKSVVELPWSSYSTSSWISSIIAFVFMILMVILMLICSILLKGSANEVERENDKNYLVSVFSGVVSMVALIVSFIALYQGVN